jgi:molybdopterin/thiamine biosynthesis adenylyltransferase
MITIVGAGALGSHVALFLRNEAELQIVDFDRVEQKNILAQFHTKMGLRKNKAVALSNTMMGLWGTKVDTVPHKLAKDNVSSVLMDSDLIIDCTDNIAAREVVHEYWDEYAVPTLHGCLGADGTFARVVWADIFAPDAEFGDGATCEDGEHLPFISYVSSIMAMVAQDFLKNGRARSYQITPRGLVQI